jgi:hypothetical protein
LQLAGGDVDTTGISEARFACAVCREPAGRVRLLPAGEPFADRSSNALEALSDLDRAIRPAGAAAVVVESFCGVDHLPVPTERLVTVSDAVGKSDASALRGIGFSYAPFHCPDCMSSYCGEHWSARRFVDGDITGVEGTCPQGHFHVLRY